METLSRNAPSTLVTKQHYAVKMDGSAGIVIAGANEAHGILQNDPAANEIATVCLRGISWAICSGNGTAIAEGDPLGSDASGVLVKEIWDTDAIFAYSLEACTTATTKIRVLVLGKTRY